VRVEGGKWVSAIGWSNVDVSNDDESVLILRDESAMWTAAPSACSTVATIIADNAFPMQAVRAGLIAL
jgi:hypothetical protein